MTKSPPPQPPADVLPWDVALALQRASRVRNTSANPLARSKAIDQAARAARLKYPQFFRAIPFKE